MAIISNAVTIADAGAFSVSLGSLIHIKTLTASSDATLSFVNGAASVVFDNTYPIYLFKFINIHPETDAADFQFQVDTGTNTSYNQTITSCGLVSEHLEDDSATTLSTHTGSAVLHQETGFQDLGRNPGGDNADDCLSGYLYIYDPSNATFVKHFTAIINETGSETSSNRFISGYINTTTALTRVQFKMDSGDIEAGTIKLYGLKDS